MNTNVILKRYFFILISMLMLNSVLLARWSELRERDFSLRNTSGTTGVNIYGDFSITGASSMYIKNTNNSTLVDQTGKYLTSVNTIALNSSTEDLIIPADATITKAYLYWSGHIYGSNPAQYNASIAGYNQVILRTPDNVNHTITADINDLTKVSYYAYINDQGTGRGFRHFYQATADVTDIINHGGYDPSKNNTKSITVGNIKSTSGADIYIAAAHRNWASNTKFGPMGGWSLIVEYERPIASGQKYKNVSIYDGFKFVIGTATNPTPTVTVPINGFLTPLTGTVNSNIAFYAMGGDRGIGGNNYPDTFSLTNKANQSQSLYNVLNPYNNILNSTMSINGTVIDASYTPGIDMDVFNNVCRAANGNAVSCIENSQTSTTLSMRVTYNNGNTDQAFAGMLAFSTDIYQPNISSFRKDSNTSSTQKLNPGDTVKYALDFNNSGTEAAEKITIYDTFSSTVGGDMLLNVIDRNATALKNSIRLKTFGEANYHCAIGSTDPACAALNKDANCSVDYADANTSKATRLWCYIPYMAVNDRYLMTFTTKIKSDYDTTSTEQNITNVAYSEYYNASTHELITQQGRSNVNTAGTVGGAVAYSGKLDIIDSFDNTYNYNIPVGLKTKIAGKNNTTLTAVYLGSDATNYHPTIYSGTNYDMLVLFTLSDNTCAQNNPISSSGDVTATFTHDGSQYTAVSNSFTMISNAMRVGRVKANFIDWNKISFSSFNGNNCVSHASVNGNLKGVPECLNGNSDKITTMFSYDVSTCVTPQAGKDAACDSNAYNANGSKGNIAPAKYNNTYGCLMCLSDAVNGANNCSQDNFAIRPDKFVISSSQSHYPNLLRAGSPYSVSLTATQYSSASATPDYNQTTNNLTSSSTKWLNTNPLTTNGTGGVTLPYTGDVNLSTISFLNGISQSGSTFKYDDVGRLDMNITDQNWAAIDAGDGTPANCSSTGRFICGDVNVTFIPHHFDFNTTTILNNDGPSPANQFTYLANQVDQMAARIQATVRALNASGNITQNFGTAPMWENNVTVVPTVRSSTYIYHDANESNITNKAIGFSLGSKNVNWNETNSSKYLRFNFQRDVNRTFNPFVVSVSDLNLSVSSHYTQAVSGHDSSASITGLKIGADSGSATFLYGRTHAPRYRFPTSYGDAQVYYETYCDANGNKTLLPTGYKGSSDSVGWYLNPLHNTSSDGNITSVLEKNGATAVSLSPLSASLATTTGITVAPLHYNGTTYPYKTTMQVAPSSWLIYDQYNSTATTNDFEVEFYGGLNSWTGKKGTPTGTTQKTTDSDAAPVTNKRILW